MNDQNTPNRANARTGDETNVGSISGSQVGAIGNNATGNVSGTLVVNSGAANEINLDQLRDVLKELWSILGQSDLSMEQQIAAQTAAGSALTEGIVGGSIEPDSLTARLKQVGDTLKQADSTVKQGSSLWNSIKNVADTIGPIVGGAAQVLKWFPILG